MSILPIFIPHAGCPHQCVFCNQKTISGQKLAAVAGAKEQLARWRSWLRPSVANETAFYGGSFTGLPLELQEELLALGDGLKNLSSRSMEPSPATLAAVSVWVSPTCWNVRLLPE